MRRRLLPSPHREVFASSPEGRARKVTGQTVHLAGP